MRAIIGAAGLVPLLISLILFLKPDLLISSWPWTLSPLTARVAGAMFALPGMVGLGIAADSRWSAARVILPILPTCVPVFLSPVARNRIPVYKISIA